MKYFKSIIQRDLDSPSNMGGALTTVADDPNEGWNHDGTVDSVNDNSPDEVVRLEEESKQKEADRLPAEKAAAEAAAKGGDDKGGDVNDGNGDDANTLELEVPEGYEEQEVINGIETAEALHKQLGFAQEFDAKQFVDTFGYGNKGLTKFIETVVEHSRDSLIREIPIVEQFYRHMKTVGDPTTFFQDVIVPTNFDSFDIKNPEDRVRIRTQYYKTNSTLPDKEIQRLVQLDLDSPDADDKVKVALDDWKANETKLVSNKEAARLQRIEDEKIRQQTEWNNTVNHIKSAKAIGGIPIPESKKIEFLNFIGGVNPQTGRTPYTDFLQSEDAALKLAYVAFHNFDLEKLASLAKGEAIKELKVVIKRKEGSKQRGVGQGERKDNPDVFASLGNIDEYFVPSK